MLPLLPAFGGHQDKDNLIFIYIYIYNVFLLVQSRVLDEHMFFVTPAKDLSTKDAHETTPTESYAAGSLGFFVLCNSNSSKVCFVHCAFYKDALVNSFPENAATFYFAPVSFPSVCGKLFKHKCYDHC